METHKPGEAIGLDAKQIADELEKFKLRLLLDYPFFGDILLRLPIIQDDGIPTACTDGRTIRWSSGVFGTLYPAQMRYVLMHEVLHTLLLHPLRTQGLDHEVWNIAADLVVNQMCDALASDFRRKQGLLLERPYSGVFSQVPRTTKAGGNAARCSYGSSTGRPAGPAASHCPLRFLTATCGAGTTAASG